MHTPSSGQSTRRTQNLLSNQVLAHVFALGVPAFSLFHLDAASIEKLVREYQNQPRIIYPSFDHASGQSVTITYADAIDGRLLTELARVFEDLSKNQVDLPMPDKKLLYKNLWQLYE